MPHPSNEQTLRRDAIRELLQRAPIPTQRALVERLDARGFPATQSSVSRDLKELGAIKTTLGYELPADGHDGAQALENIAEFVRDIRPAGPHVLVVRTAIGAAQRVALALDRCEWPEMVGNIGGDDTVFVATDSATGQKILTAKIERAISR